MKWPCLPIVCPGQSEGMRGLASSLGMRETSSHANSSHDFGTTLLSQFPRIRDQYNCLEIQNRELPTFLPTHASLKDLFFKVMVLYWSPIEDCLALMYS